MSETWTKMSDDLSAAVERAAPSVLALLGRKRSLSATAISEELAVTAAHGVWRRDEVRVRKPDGNEAVAKVVGRDFGTDLAVLRVDGGGLMPIARADAAKVRVGDIALALGRPGRAIRASLRMVGLLASDVQTRGGARLSRWIETDRGLPDGFAGGPLVDAQGALIGLSTDGLVSGADLAIPSDVIDTVVSEIDAHGRVRRGWLGVAVHPARFPKAVADVVGVGRGALVVGLEDGGPAERAGVLVGDTLIAIDGEAIAGPEDVVAALRGRGAVRTHVKLVRAGAVVELDVEAGLRAA